MVYTTRSRGTPGKRSGISQPTGKSPYVFNDEDDDIMMDTEGMFFDSDDELKDPDFIEVGPERPQKYQRSREQQPRHAFDSHDTSNAAAPPPAAPYDFGVSPAHRASLSAVYTTPSKSQGRNTFKTGFTSPSKTGWTPLGKTGYTPPGKTKTPEHIRQFFDALPHEHQNNLYYENILPPYNTLPQDYTMPQQNAFAYDNQQPGFWGNADDIAASTLLNLAANPSNNPFGPQVMWEPEQQDTSYAPIYPVQDQDAVDHGNHFGGQPITVDQIDPYLLKPTGNDFAPSYNQPPRDNYGPSYETGSDLPPAPAAKQNTRAEPGIKNRKRRRSSLGDGGMGDDSFIPPLDAHKPAHLTGFNPPSYTGPPAQAMSTYSVHTGEGHVTYVKYLPLAPHNGFHYTARGYLDPKLKFTPELLQRFIGYHPLGKNLMLRLEKNPQACTDRYDSIVSTVCRSKFCLESEVNRITAGQLRVAIEEVWGRLPRCERDSNDPFFAAGYFHLPCFESLIDIGQLIRLGMFRTFPREQFGLETSANKVDPNRFCLVNQLNVCFKLFAKKLIENPTYTDYLTNVRSMLSTELWLNGIRKNGFNRAVPPQLPVTNAKRLHENRPSVPTWGGSRVRGLRESDAARLRALGKEDVLLLNPGNRRNSQALRILEQEKWEKRQLYTDGAEFLEEVVGIRLPGGQAESESARGSHKRLRRARVE